jgi:hypothetical protein
MKTIGIIGILLLAISFHSCTPSCSCSMYCIEYNHNAVKVCQTFMNSGDFNRINDSLNNLYGPASDTITKSRFGIPSNKELQYINQGYDCFCAK